MQFFEIIFKIFLVILTSSIIGYERELRHKEAGLRTHLLVGIGSALIAMTSLFIFETYRLIHPIDPSRMLAAIIQGIGFLCAGTIIRAGSNVKGLTTAATLWIVSCIGISIGVGYYLAAIIVTLMVFLILISMKIMNYN